MSEPKNHFNSFNVYMISFNKNDNQNIYDYFLNELYQQNTNSLIINYNDKTINIIFNDLDDIFTFNIFKEDASLYTIYEDMKPYSIIYNQTDTEKQEFIDFLNYLNIDEEPYIYNNSYMN
jgi:hypothetical protein